MSALGTRASRADGIFADNGISKLARAHAVHRAVFLLALSYPEFSARTVVTQAQMIVLLSVAISLGLVCLLWPGMMADVAVFAMSIGFLLSMLLRAGLAWRGRCARSSPEPGDDAWLPVYTIIVPLLHEAHMLRHLHEALSALDYPPEKLDVKFVVEETDAETRAEAEKLGAHSIVVVPDGLPRTKPKACNYALHFTRGEYVVVYDAEDRPQPDQLRKAVAAFRRHPEVTCFQARLGIGNDRRNWLTRMFALDYGIWFRTLLPGLDRLRAPIPLGGTSNHFRTAHLLRAGAWDPFNVTEDADLGIRLARFGYRVAMLDSTTFEDAPTRFDPWFRQRTRWMKGYMQTLLVHTRAPVDLVRSIGPRGFVVIQGFLAGAVWSALVNPLLWLVFLAGIFPGSKHGVLDILAQVSGVTLFAANGLLAALSLVDEKGKGGFSALAVAASYPFYWLLISAAAYRAVWQLVREPHRWEKTPHGVEET